MGVDPPRGVDPSPIGPAGQDLLPGEKSRICSLPECIEVRHADDGVCYRLPRQAGRTGIVGVPTILLAGALIVVGGCLAMAGNAGERLREGPTSTLAFRVFYLLFPAALVVGSARLALTGLLRIVGQGNQKGNQK